MAQKIRSAIHGIIESGEIQMKKSKFSESQTVDILKEAEAGVGTEELVRQHRFSKASFYKWKSKYSGMLASDLNRRKELEEGNRWLKQMYANLSFEHAVLKDIIEKKLGNQKSGEIWSSTQSPNMS